MENRMEENIMIRKKTRSVLATSLCALTVGLVAVAGANEKNPPHGINPERYAVAERAMARGIDFLVKHQQASGAWSNTNFPALTALPLWAFARSGQEKLEPNMQRAVDYIKSCVSDGGMFKGAIYRPVQGRKGGGLVNYNTAICMTALHAVGDPKLRPIVLDARAFLSRSQYAGGSLHHGGMGYDPPTGRSYADLSNSYIAYEAMRLTQDVEEFRPGGPSVSLDWQAALKYIQRCHNHPDFNDQPWASDKPSEKGGFAYRPDTYREDFGAFEGKDGVLEFRSAPGMTYAGLLSYIYAGLDRNDPRVRATVAWIRENWNPDIANRNPDLAGKPEEKGGLFYMYNTMTRGLAAYGQDVLRRKDGTEIRWRDEMIKKLADLQHEEGYWVNTYNRYWEGDPVLVTAYAVMALQSAIGR
jgi:squalene-hopene/tetraprenyl-beta-curcumene cyclase